MADTVASRSGFLSTYMGNHPDTLVAYVRHFGKVSVPVVSASMVSINKHGMTLLYTVKGSETKKEVTVTFNPPLSGYEEVKPRLLHMKLDAEEALGMVRRPQITTFKLPSNAGSMVPLLILLIYVTFSVPTPTSSFRNIGPWLRGAVGGPTTIRYIWILVFVLHTGEALYTASLCKRHSTGILNGMKWTFSVSILGFPVLMQLRKLIQKARIDSIMKVP